MLNQCVVTKRDGKMGHILLHVVTHNVLFPELKPHTVIRLFGTYEFYLYIYKKFHYIIILKHVFVFLFR